MPSRRQFIAGSAAGIGVAATVQANLSAFAAAGRVFQDAPTGLAKFADPLPALKILKPDTALTIRQRATTVKLHSQLPATPVWAYEGAFPGPVIDARRGRRIKVSWQNRIEGKFPATAVSVPFTGLDSILSPGRGGAAPIEDVANLAPWVVTHLHGGEISGDSDGWPKNGISFGQAQATEYPNDQRAATLWYHDHAMDITAYNVFAGLAGLYLVRDAEEDALRLPAGKYEVPLIIADRNLDTDDSGAFNGRLLHKVGYYDVPGARVSLPFAGPYNLANGVIWPYLDVEPRWYRFRLLNGANARTYTLELRKENADGTSTPVTGAFVQIGTEQGLLGAPAKQDRITLSPAERADILINFAAFRGARLQLSNTDTATSPLGPEILQFRVSGTAVTDTFAPPAKVSPTFARLAAAKVPALAVQRYVATATHDGTTGGHPELWELAKNPAGYVPQKGDRIVNLVKNGTTTSFRKVAGTFDEAVTFHVALDGWEVWNFVHLAGPNHPTHVHLISFQALARDTYTVSVVNDAANDVYTYTATYSAAKGLGPDEQGWKDTIRIDEHDVVTVAGQFRGGTGNYVYHCHILEHEDHGMMRPFVVAPKTIQTAMASGMGAKPIGGGKGGHGGHGGH
ncbi:multicopper oxidase family protein [Actinomadura parmotrematis]|uniref:Multicopper oxidase CueO n=1 Tax=Actinomadura parmotrematis TaxID=2864039 RepID=A0ABS7G0H1_9ACTN|nr:multicopper oxidase domain-containing protein [Actinomadura parmotrematis]MBW8486209.1 multicopper oxidase domain-containing protein [Actinomadura parmotrematis]